MNNNFIKIFKSFKSTYDIYIHLRFIMWIVIFNEYILDFYLLEGESMVPNFKPYGEIVILNKITPKFIDYKKNDVICILSPCDNTVKMCKRIIHDENESFLNKNGTLITVPKNHIWVEGDNKSNSLDSRQLGPISKHLIIGRVSFRVWPLRNFGLFRQKTEECIINDIKQSNL